MQVNNTFSFHLNTISQDAQITPELNLLQFLKDHFEDSLTQKDIRELHVLKGKVTKLTGRYIDQFIIKDGPFRKLPFDIQKHIFSFLESSEQFAPLKRAIPQFDQQKLEHATGKKLIHPWLFYMEGFPPEVIKGLDINTSIDCDHFQKMTRLERLKINFHSVSYAWIILQTRLMTVLNSLTFFDNDGADIIPSLKACLLPNLRILSFVNCSSSSFLLEEIPRLPFLSQLTSLDLQNMGVLNTHLTRIVPFIPKTLIATF